MGSSARSGGCRGSHARRGTPGRHTPSGFRRGRPAQRPVFLDHRQWGERRDPEPLVHDRVGDAQAEDESAVARLVELRGGLGGQHRRTQCGVGDGGPPPGHAASRQLTGCTAPQRVAVPWRRTQRCAGSSAAPAGAPTSPAAARCAGRSTDPGACSWLASVSCSRSSRPEHLAGRRCRDKRRTPRSCGTCSAWWHGASADRLMRGDHEGADTPCWSCDGGCCGGVVRSD